MKKNHKEKILVAMSGGVDSSVAAALLVKKGYDVAGAFMVNYDDSHHPSPLLGQEGINCWSRDYQDALRVAAKLGIPLMRLNFTKEYKKLVLDYMYREYAAGRTPNPDVLCNKFIKFGVWLKKAKALGFDKLATGHYARLRLGKLLEAKDKNKDQTYFLHQLTQAQLKYVLFPIGEYSKPQIRALAKKFGLATAEKEESMGICFVGEVPMKKFLMKKIKPRPGKITTSSGEAIGKHDGLPFYTIGQRIGTTTPTPPRKQGGDTKPLYVVAKNKKTNELVAGFENDQLLYKKEIEVGELNWISGTPKFPLKCTARLRHRQPLQACTVKKINFKIKVFFSKPQRAVTPGQFAVFYSARRSSQRAKAGKSGACLGGGVIK